MLSQVGWWCCGQLDEPTGLELTVESRRPAADGHPKRESNKIVLRRDFDQRLLSSLLDSIPSGLME